MKSDQENHFSEQQITDKTRKRRQILKKIIRNNRQTTSGKQFELLLNLDRQLFLGYSAYRLGNFCIEQNRLDLAEENLLKAKNVIEQKFLFTNVYLSLGNLETKRNHLLKACIYYEMVISLSPHKNSKIYLNQDQIIFAGMLNSFKFYTQAHDRLIKCYIQTNQLEKSYQICMKALEFKDQESSVIADFADAIYKSLGNRDNALNFAWEKFKEEAKIREFSPQISFQLLAINPLLKQPQIEKIQKKISIFTLKWQQKYSSQQANNLYRTILKNTTWQVDFYCITDDKYGIDKSIKIKMLDDQWKKQWGKCLSFQQLQVLCKEQSSSKNAYFDLDIIITGNLDSLFQYAGEFATIFQESQLKMQESVDTFCSYQSSIMIWNGNKLKNLYKMVQKNLKVMEKLIVKFDFLLDLTVRNAHNLNILYPTQIVKFESHFSNSLPENCMIVYFEKNTKSIEINTKKLINKFQWVEKIKLNH